MAEHKKADQPAGETKELGDVVLQIDRVSRTVKGGRRIRFRALVIVGNHNGQVGMGTGKASEVAGAVAKATGYAKKHMINVPIKNGTIPHEITTRFGNARIIMKPAAKGTSIIAGGAVRTIAELAGIQNLIAKVIGDASKINTAEATLNAFRNLRQVQGSKND